MTTRSYTEADPNNPATHARFGVRSPEHSATTWSDQTDKWIMECLGDLLGLALTP